VRQLAPDVVVLDMMMPEVDGLEFLEQLPRIAPVPPPVIANSGFEAFEQRALALGARTFLRKPVPRDALTGAIERVLAGQEETRAEQAAEERVVVQRREACRARDRLWSQIDLEAPELRGPIEALAAWLQRYFGFGTVLVDLMCGDRIYVYVGSTKAGRLIVDRSFAFCSDVVDAGSSLLIPDALSHPVFAGHRAISYWGTRFYAGCPITVGAQLVVGTLCLVDTVPRTFNIIDMRLLEHLAGGVGALLEAGVGERAAQARFFEPPALFDRGTLESLLEMRLHERTDAELVLANFEPGEASSDAVSAAARAVNEAAAGLRVLCARHSPRTLAILCDGRDPASARDRALDALRRAALLPRRVGVATYRAARFHDVPAGDNVTASQLIVTAEEASTRSGREGGATTVDEVPATRP
jgi:hypothetical protein